MSNNFPVRDDARVDEILDRLVVLERQVSAVDAERARLLAELGAMPDPRPAGAVPLPHRNLVQEEVACALRWSVNLVGRRTGTAVALVDRLPGTLAALAAGEISHRHAERIVDAAEGLEQGVLAEFEAQVLARAGSQTAAEVARVARRVALRLDPRSSIENHLCALLARRVCLEPDRDGMCWVNSYLPADGAATVWLAVQAAADEPDPAGSAVPAETADQRRADALVAICAGYLAGSTSLVHGRRPSVAVTVALSTLLGLDDQPGDLAGHGPIPAVLARRIAADPTGTWRRLITDDTGALIDAGRTRYRPPADLREHVLARDATCTRPGCQRPARTCDIDHLHDWQHGGHTDADNLGPECSRDHHVKHDAGWTIRRLPDGTVRWTSPTGREYDKPPTTLPLDQTASATDADPPPF